MVKMEQFYYMVRLVNIFKCLYKKNNIILIIFYNIIILNIYLFLLTFFQFIKYKILFKKDLEKPIQ